MAEEDLAQGIAELGLAQCDGITAQGLGDAERLAAIAEPALGLDPTHLEIIWILDRWQRFRKWNRTRAITGHRSSQAERIMRAHQVVAVAKGIELALAVLEAGEVEVAQDFELERAMEALVLALGLRMIRTAVADSDPEPNQPQTKAGERLSSGRAPRRAVVHQHRGRQTVAAKSLGQHRAHGLVALVGAGLEHQREARVIVEHGQRMAADRRANRGEVALEVHLPQFVGCWALKALKGARRRRSLVEQTVAAQDAGDSTRRQLWAAFYNQPSRQLASAPRTEHRAAHFDHPLLDLRRGALGRASRLARAIDKPAAALLGIAQQPLVAGLRRYLEAPAQPAPISSRLYRQLHKLLARPHPGNLPPWHPAHLPLEIQHAA